jgi:hypothetical protein
MEERHPSSCPRSLDGARTSCDDSSSYKVCVEVPVTKFAAKVPVTKFVKVVAVTKFVRA